jgi:hypothetical protein
MVAILTAHTQEAILQATALEKIFEFLLNVGGVGFALELPARL